ncbi:MAG: D-Ala-D-Ala dipeptidase [Alphaproteobacteria bacterium]|nr:D-Ala-D-Ala dipeptidase [Alphaproteobacteria bacterium]
MKILSRADFVALDDFVDTHPVKIDLVYAQPDHKDNVFKTALYRSGARMWGYRDLVDIVLHAADICHKETGYIFELKDCLRPIEAQQRMIETEIVKANPHWLKEPDQLLSLPGQGGHPRGMAVDIVLLDANGDEVDMGTSFDYFTPDPARNPAARDFTDLPDDVLENRKVLERAMLQAGAAAGHEILPLPSEWWDFRFRAAYSSRFKPVSDRDLPPEMRMV